MATCILHCRADELIRFVGSLRSKVTRLIMYAFKTMVIVIRLLFINVVYTRYDEIPALNFRFMYVSCRANELSRFLGHEVKGHLAHYVCKNSLYLNACLSISLLTDRLLLNSGHLEYRANCTEYAFLGIYEVKVQFWSYMIICRNCLSNHDILQNLLMDYKWTWIVKNFWKLFWQGAKIDYYGAAGSCRICRICAREIDIFTASQVFLRWKRRQEPEGDLLGALSAALKKCGRDSLADKVVKGEWW